MEDISDSEIRELMQRLAPDTPEQASTQFDGPIAQPPANALSWSEAPPLPDDTIRFSTALEQQLEEQRAELTRTWPSGDVTAPCTSHMVRSLAPKVPRAPLWESAHSRGGERMVEQQRMVELLQRQMRENGDEQRAIMSQLGERQAQMLECMTGKITDMTSNITDSQRTMFESVGKLTEEVAGMTKCMLTCFTKTMEMLGQQRALPAPAHEQRSLPPITTTDGTVDAAAAATACSSSRSSIATIHIRYTFRMGEYPGQLMQFVCGVDVPNGSISPEQVEALCDDMDGIRNEHIYGRVDAHGVRLVVHGEVTEEVKVGNEWRDSYSFLSERFGTSVAERVCLLSAPTVGAKRLAPEGGHEAAPSSKRGRCRRATELIKELEREVRKGSDDGDVIVIADEEEEQDESEDDDGMEYDDDDDFVMDEEDEDDTAAVAAPVAQRIEPKTRSRAKRRRGLTPETARVQFCETYPVDTDLGRQVGEELARAVRLVAPEHVDRDALCDEVKALCELVFRSKKPLDTVEPAKPNNRSVRAQLQSVWKEWLQDDDEAFTKCANVLCAHLFQLKHPTMLSITNKTRWLQLCAIAGADSGMPAWVDAKRRQKSYAQELLFVYVMRSPWVDKLRALCA